jgi:ParB family transcriptional regulator, chromosome partitioning protein
MSGNLKIIHLDPRSLKPNGFNSNYVGPENEAKLRESLRKFGCYKPVICRELADGTLQILGGQHRAMAAADLKFETVPVVNLGRIDDKRAKAIGLADNGRYGEDDMTKLSAVIAELGEDAATYLPFSDQDLASLFAIGDIAITELDDDDGKDLGELVEQVSKPTLTHELLRFKVPIEDAGLIREVIDLLIKTKGYAKEQDSLAAAGMALVDVVKAGKAHLK